jgi:hypothetical protein
MRCLLTASLLLSICFMFAGFNNAQIIKGGGQDYAQFLIDLSKPYAYLEVDHVGPRKPLRGDEPHTGIWLRLRNNCRLPIAVVAVETQTENADGIIVQDEIVPSAQGPAIGGDGIGGGILAPREQGQILGLFRWPNRIEDEIRAAEEAARISSKLVQRPRGYGSQSGFDSFRLITIAPGDQVLFSVPSNHVSSAWHLEISFRLAVPNNSPIRPPYSYLAFYQNDLDRATGSVPRVILRGSPPRR